LQQVYDEFERRDTVVIAIAQEDTDLDKHAQMAAKIKPKPRFEIVADLNRAKTGAYDRITAYLIDKNGRVRQIFPMLVRTRPSWEAVLNEIDRIGEPSG
jgi:peroxiredoxin